MSMAGWTLLRQALHQASLRRSRKLSVMQHTGLSKLGSPPSADKTLRFCLTESWHADVHRFDANAIPLEGPYGLVAAASRLLDTAGTLDERSKRALLDRFIGVVRENQL